MKWLLKIKNDLKLTVKENKTENCSQYHSHYLTKQDSATKMSAIMFIHWFHFDLCQYL